ncbi:PHP domain-containing protein [Methanoplanus endosymbiosus]|uniref:PHP domain-containing protein n=1 Tax=Methanoplanus endosymbiosus TaxID=33865 RepID=A0A9E7TGW2_9EURY|nr:PHP domain-containing protein [Methanoplanus endosymbiosus]UUX91812.1 PHP domain-containing protein [Methanoplanus endosymbiosus]
MIKFDLHIHSKYSNDSLLPPEKILKQAEKNFLNVIAITDHDTIKGGIECRKISQDKILVIVGSEISTECGDLIGLFLTDEIKSNIFGEVVDEIHGQGGVALLPHPYRRKKFPDDIALKSVDIIEGINGRTSYELNYKALVLADKLNKTVVSGSDAHFSFEIGRLYSEFSVEFRFDEAYIKDLLLRGKDINICNESTCFPHYIQKSAMLTSYAIKKWNSLR